MEKMSQARRALMTKSVALAGMAAAAAGAPAATPAAGAKYKAVFQVSDADPKKWALTLNNVKNVQDEMGAANIAIEVVVYGPGIGMLKADAEIANRVLEAMQAGVGVLACENTMRNMHIGRDDMISKIGFVAAGVAQLIKRQAEGYAYIRA